MEVQSFLIYALYHERYCSIINCHVTPLCVYHKLPHILVHLDDGLYRIHFQYKQWGEFVEVSIRFILCDHVLNSHDHSVLHSNDITRRNFMLITLRA